MGMSQQELSDRLEIQDLLFDYSEAIDSKNFDALDEVFTPDAYIDYTCVGGIKGRYPEIKEYLQKALTHFPRYQHMLGNCRIRLNGDAATARTICHNPMVMKSKEGEEQVAFYGIWYVDKLVRTDKGWRLSERVEEFAYAHNVPPGFEPPVEK